MFCIDSLVMMMIGVSNMIGRILSGAASDISCVNCIIFNSLSFLATGKSILHISKYISEGYISWVLVTTKPDYIIKYYILGVSICGFVFCGTYVQFMVVGACFGLSFSAW